MEPIVANITVKGEKEFNAKAAKMRFSPHRCFTYNSDPEELNCIKLIGDYLKDNYPNLAIYGNGKFSEYLLENNPGLKSHVKFQIEDDSHARPQDNGIPVITADELPPEIKTVFMSETLTFRRMQMSKKLKPGIEVITPEILKDIDWKAIPKKAWIPDYDTIYPLDVPEIEFIPDQDLILIDCPSRNMAFMPNGLAYVHNALRKTKIKYQTLDLDIIFYHRYHIYRLFDAPGPITTDTGETLPDDPWLAENYELWQKPEIIEYFRPEIDEVIQALVKAKPKILGLSIQACNLNLSREVVKGVKDALPETIILVGGYSCYQSSIGRSVFPESDYMIIGEADFTVGPLVEKLAAGERPKDMDGVMSRYDTPKRLFTPGPTPQDLNILDMPQYDWYDLDVYRNYDHYQLTPIIASRGCRWSRCTFCAERFFWRVRSPKNVVDEFEWLADHGCDLFMFNESDLNGNPDILLEICDEIIRRKLTIRLTGQLRIHKKSDRAFFDKLRAAGFVSLRFGVDAWSKNALRLQLKGYTKDMIYQNLKDCFDAGIYTEVNTVIGVPGETEEDIAEAVELNVKCKPYIGRLANINPLLLVIGSVYWENPDKFNIRFREDKKKIFEKHHTMIPDNLWYSEGPYIDGEVRKKYFEKMVLELHKSGFEVGAFAKQVIEDVLSGKGAQKSARPDLATSKKMPVDDKIKNEGELIKVQSQLPVDNSTNNIRYQIINVGEDFYGIDINKMDTDGGLTATYAIKKASAVKGLSRFLIEKCLEVIRHPQRFSHFASRAMHILRTGGVVELAKMMSDSGNSTPMSSLAVDPEAEVKISKDVSASISLIMEGFNGYNIIKVGRDLYGIKQGFPFDINLVDAGEYEPGVLFKAGNIKKVKESISSYISQN